MKANLPTKVFGKYVLFYRYISPIYLFPSMLYKYVNLGFFISVMEPLGVLIGIGLQVSIRCTTYYLSITQTLE